MIYKAYDVWVRISQFKAIRYRCMEAIDSGLVCVQNSDTITGGLESSDLRNLDGIFVEALLEQAPEERAQGWSKTVQEAIEKHELLFKEERS